ncbi:hypothetical protein BL02_167 [Klebsiella phage BL02]|uniref:Uncharacterized protein n=1 Tax=Klebsiella phage KP27 TaxID=1129147 RepID=K7NTJ8_9CAUD|nr:hypothetical protein KP27_180 [Klebsiella phage KP27]URQ04420.1 hypothetical protein BL02_167 [Klebsiella phage BL02]WKC55417.1 hypothetical protein R21_251 [Klebsiella phage R2_1]BEH83458.1 hypothetical protein [Klebsiella phage phiKp_1]BEH83853.1 hypothetical protein [Klebsiella phage phiKp_3]BEH83974.1 hypothetical protein [Klebsiella phage phiKp_4]BEH84251.1 hypothetical protein [Klebsiella phage phiKp_5]BEH84754.1 hypothetical protein [Klebsiella phage phiKp_8]BEH85113.1 hypothetica
MRFRPYIEFLRGISEILNREIKPSPLAVELYRLNATPEDAAKDYGNEL